MQVNLTKLKIILKIFNYPEIYKRTQENYELA